MPTVHENCSNCGAQLPARAPGEVIRCVFCGTENRFAAAPSPPNPFAPSAASPAFVQPAVAAHPPMPVAPSSSGGGCGVALAVLAVIIGGVAILIFSARSGGAFNPKTKVADLHTANVVWDNNLPIDAPPVVGSLQHFDVLANFDWASAIAHGWWPDAEMKSVEIDPIGKDGYADLTVDSAKAEWDFFSAGCVADHKKRAETTKVEDNTCHLLVEVTNRGVEVSMELIGDDDLKTIKKPSCTLGEVFARLSQDNKLQPRPNYSARLKDGTFGYYWSIGAGNGSASMDQYPEIHPEFCKGTAPYGH